jgi:hypothetical protein
MCEVAQTRSASNHRSLQTAIGNEIARFGNRLHGRTAVRMYGG